MKEPWLAVLLSTIFPGIGQIYAGRRLRGALVFGLAIFLLGAIAQLMLSSTGSIRLAVQCSLGLLILSLLNLFDAHRCARRANDSDFEDYRKDNKDPWLAVFLSNIIPGLGHAYQGDWPFAILFFVLIIGARIVLSAVPLLAWIATLLLIVCFLHVYVSSPTEREKNRGQLVNVCWVFFLANILSLVLALSVRTFVAEARYIPSDTMQPAVQIDDRIFVNKFVYRYQAPERGDVIVFDAPEPALDVVGSTTSVVYLKRIIGIPGDTVEVKNGKVFLNGEALVENYIQSPMSYEWGPETVPNDAYFVLGDNRNSNSDSHVWGFLPAENIFGRASKIFWPPKRQRLI
ncbi:MAG: signal peptidase I [Cyanobacteria bacterium P01_D01_bin.36]